MVYSRKTFVLIIVSLFGAFFFGYVWDNPIVRSEEDQTVPAKVAQDGILRWKSVRSGGYRVGQVVRASVPGGWLVLVRETKPSERERDPGLTFVPDPDHAWGVR